jgi:RHS repeat-associated protein
MFDRDYNQLNVQADVNAHFEYWLSDAINHDEPEEMIFFYHKDLPKAFGMGSSTQISDIDANIIQHIEYLPYGETFFERRMDDYWTTPYKFNAKELDAETGMYYYGARYYTPEVSIWLSVDPLAGEYPSLSPYAYCGGNPIKYIDPDGMSLGIPPFTVHYYTNINGVQTNRVVAQYISASQRRGFGALATLSIGIVGSIVPGSSYAVFALDLYKAIEQNDYHSFAQTWATLIPLGACTEVCSAASMDKVVGVNMQSFGNAATVFRMGKAAIGMGFTIYEVSKILDSPPRNSEQLANLTYRALESANIGSINPSNDGLFAFNKSFNGNLQEAERIANTTYRGVEQIFRQFNFSEDGAVSASERFVGSFGARIVRDSQNMINEDTTLGL